MNEQGTIDLNQKFLKNQTHKTIIAVGLTIVLITFVILAFVLYPQPEAKYYNKFVHPYPNEVIDATFWELNYTDMKLQGFQAYEEGNYNFAIEMFNRHLDDEFDDGIVRFYMGESYMVLHKPREALRQYELALKSGGNTYKSVIDWHRAVCYLMFDEKSTELREILERIIDNRDHPYFEEASEVYGDLFT